MASFFTSNQLQRNTLFIGLLIVLGFATLTAQNYSGYKINVKNTELVTKHMNWVYGGYRFTLDMHFNENTYNYYKSQSKKNSYDFYAQEHTGYTYLSQLAKQLKEDADQLGYTGWKLAEYLTAFVQQNITYTKDPYNYCFDYPKFPIETLVEKSGDCEDSAILLVVLLKLFNFDAVLIQVPGHMAVGLACSNCSAYYNFEGKKYAYIESTNSNGKIGYIPTDYKNVSAQLIKIPNIKPYQPVVTTPKPNQWEEECYCKPKKETKVITIGGEEYTIRVNETLVIKQNGLTISVSN
ncbi:MAG: hypothetical protein KDC52_18685 [Ignavibacteriae bacterium]|nr:hypothetical protein [Ignavibacteriota bacterium]